MNDTQSFIGWEQLAGNAATITSAWAERQRDVTAKPGVISSNLFEVVDGGHGALVCIYELESSDAAEAAAVLVDEGWGKSSGVTGPPSIFRQVFAAPDARSLSSARDYVFAVRADVNPPDPEDFEHWYNDVHVPDVEGAGLARARRYHATSPGAKYLATYEIKGPDVMETDALKKVRGFHEYTDYVKDIQRWILKPRASS
jgi:hypothetical protein